MTPILETEILLTFILTCHRTFFSWAHASIATVNTCYVYLLIIIANFEADISDILLHFSVTTAEPSHSKCPLLWLTKPGNFGVYIWTQIARDPRNSINCV